MTCFKLPMQLIWLTLLIGPHSLLHQTSVGFSAKQLQQLAQAVSMITSNSSSFGNNNAYEMLKVCLHFLLPQLIVYLLNLGFWIVELYHITFDSTLFTQNINNHLLIYPLVPRPQSPPAAPYHSILISL